MPSLLSALLLTLVAFNAFAGGRELAPRPLGPSAYGQQAPQVAYAGGKYLTVWLELMDDAGWRYLGAFSDRAGHRLSPSAFVVVPNPGAGPAQLLGTGNSFALFFPVETGALMLDIDLAGHVTGTRTVEIENFRFNPAVAWNGTHFVAVEGTRALFFDRSGTIVRKVTLSCRPTRHEVLSVREDVIVAGTCQNGGGLRADVFDRNGQRTAIAELEPEVYDVRVAATAADDGGMLFAWGSSGLEQVLKTARVSASGTVAPRKVIAAGNQPYEPLLLTRTAAGFLLPYLQHGRLSVASLTEDGSLGAVTPSPETSFGHPASAATDGTGVLVSDIQFVSQQSPGRVRTQLIAPDGETGTADVLSITPSRQLAPALGAGSGSLVAVWTEQQGQTSSVRSAHLAADGTPLSNSVIDPNATLVSRDLAWNGSHYLTVIHRNGQLRSQRLNAFGEKVGSAMLLYTSDGGFRLPRVSVVWADDHWEVAGTDMITAFHCTVSADGKDVSWEQLQLEGTLPDDQTVRTSIYDVAIAWDGARALVAWIEGQYYPCNFECIEARPAFVTTIDPIAHAVTGAHRISEPWEGAESLSLATNGGEVVAAMTRYDRNTLVTAVDASLERTASRNFDGVADVAWDGTSFVLALRERTELTVRRLDANLRDAARARFASIAPADVVGSAPSVAVAIPGNAIVGVQEVEANSGARALAYVEQELGNEPQRRRTVRR